MMFPKLQRANHMNFVETTKGTRVAQVFVSDEISAPPELAALFAAAPELLALLERILGASETKNNGAYMGEAVLCKYFEEAARAVIAKAKGEAE